MEQGIVRQPLAAHGIVTGRKIAAVASRPESWLIGLLLWILFSAGRSVGTLWFSAALTEALRWAAGIGLALALSWYGSRSKRAAQFLVTLTGVMALFGVLGGDTIAQSGLVGPYHDHQLYGSALVLLLPFCAGVALTARSGLWQWGAVVSGIAGVLCLFLSQTRSAWIGLAAAALVFGWLWLNRPSSRPRRWHVILIPTALLLSGLLFAWLVAGPTEQRTALSNRAATLTTLSQDESWQSRLDLWRGTAALVAAHPALGIGLGRYPGNEWLWTHAGSPLAPAARPTLSNQAHSFYGQTAAEIGLIGLGLYLAALATFAVRGARRLRERRGRRGFTSQDGLLIAALSALAGQGIDALASPSWQFPEVSFLFWAVLGLGLASLRTELVKPVPARIPHPVRRLGQWAMSGTLAVVLAAQVLPTGLLTPVEAYDHGPSIAYKSLSLAQAACTSGSGHCFSLIAAYTDGNHDVTLDNGGLAGPGYQSAFSCVTQSSSACSSKFGTGNARNDLTVSLSEIGKTLKITGGFVDGAYPTNPPVPGKGTYKGYQTTLTFIPTTSP